VFHSSIVPIYITILYGISYNCNNSPNSSPADPSDFAGSTARALLILQKALKKEGGGRFLSAPVKLYPKTTEKYVADLNTILGFINKKVECTQEQLETLMKNLYFSMTSQYATELANRFPRIDIQKEIIEPFVSYCEDNRIGTAFISRWGRSYSNRM